MRSKLLAITALLFASWQITWASFSDVSTSNPDAVAINYLQTQNIISGSEDGLFHPELGLTRCELTKIALKTANITPITPASASFPDIPTSSWCHAYAYTARSHNILNGYPDGTFKPNQPVTEIEALKILLNSLAVHLPSVTTDLYQDVHATDWWSPYILFVQNNHLSNMPTSAKYGIGNQFSRAKMARIVYRGIQVKQTGQPYQDTSTTSPIDTSLDSITSDLTDLDNIDMSLFNF